MHLGNPEGRWERALPDKERVRSELGLPDTVELEVLSGGQANLCVRVGTDRVLRRFQRDPASAAVEAALLRRPWQRLRIPRLLSEGDDHLWLEFVAHGPVPGDAAAGARVGEALREIHDAIYPKAGFLGSNLQVDRPFDDVWLALFQHVQSRDADPSLVERVLQRLDSERQALTEACRDIVLLHGDFKAANLGWTPQGELLVLDWEFAWAGPRLLDLGQILRWNPPEDFVQGLLSTHGHAGDAEVRLAETFDLVNLVGLLHRAAPGSRRQREVTHRIEQTLERA